MGENRQEKKSCMQTAWYAEPIKYSEGGGRNIKGRL